MSNVDINVDRRTDGRTENRMPISHPATSRCDKKKQLCAKHKIEQFCAKPKKGSILFRQDNKTSAEIFTDHQCILRHRIN